MANILIVDDQPEVCDVLRRLFKVSGWSADCITDPKSVYDTVRQRRPDVVMLDIMMPELDGFGILGAIRNDPEVRTIPVVMYSALDDEKTVDRALGAGADDYIVKGTPFRQIKERVGLYVNQQH
ncbi:MAG TPA: response regulator [Tepidisphaeraceae bacterium]|jgi:DNA-binding response OmpR family regulator